MKADEQEASQERPGGESGAEPGSRSLVWEDLSPELKTKVRRQLSSSVHLLHLDNLDDVMGAILETPAGHYKPPKEGRRQKLVGILVDTRVLGEANNRPAIRLPPIDVASVHKLLSAIRDRHGEAFHNRLHELDLYMTLAGQRDLCRYNAWFNKLDKTAKQVTHRNVIVHMDPESVVGRCYSRVAGVSSAKSWDMLQLTAQPWPKRTLHTVRAFALPWQHGERCYGASGHAELGQPRGVLDHKLGNQEEGVRGQHHQGRRH